MFIDTHTHIYYENNPHKLKEKLARCSTEKVNRLYLPNVDMNSIQPMFDLHSINPEKYFLMMGLHPCSVDENHQETWAKIQHKFRDKPVFAIGEIGLDYYHSIQYKKEQRASFILQIEKALSLDLPIVIHCRDSFDDIVEILESFKNGKLRGVFHCFTGNIMQAEKVINMGFYLGIGGVLTYRKSGLSETLKEIGMKHIILETDSPYLAPVPHRGKENESSFIPIIAQKLAEVKGIGLSEVAETTSHNAKNLFNSSVMA